MRLIELSSSRRSFKTVRFNESGLSLVVGKHTTRQKQNLKSTYNGVGKSLLIALLHFCLGASKNRHFDTHLAGWDFTLTFENEGKQHSVTRTVGEDKIRFDGKEMGLKPYKEELNGLGVFELPADVSSLSFRSLISFFMRPLRGSYNSPEGAVPKWIPYYQVLYQSFLLGLDYHRVVQKHDDKTKLDEQLSLAKKYKQDKDLRDFYLGEKNAEMELALLKEKIGKLTAELAKFKVAKDYSEREKAANEIRAQLAEARDEETLLGNRLANIEQAMSVRPDVTPERVKKLYAEAEVALPDIVVKRLDQVDAFQARLRQNRLRRLELEKKNAEAAQNNWQTKRVRLERDLDELLQYLKAHRALDEYTENNRYLAELTARKQKFEDYLSLVARYTQEAQRIRAEMTTATVQTTEYLEKIKPQTDQLMDAYRRFAQEFYGDKPAGLIVKNNDGDNQIRYNIEARIEHDQADGINDVRIFCFDLLLLTLRHRHNVRFLLHDSRLFSGMDPHQRWTLFRLADKVCRENGYQYIATINEDHIESMRDMAGADFDRVLVNPRILELTDEPNGSGKLLGIQIEMRYEEE